MRVEYKHPIGFVIDENEELIILPEEDTLDLNGEIIKAINILVTAIKQYEGIISGISIETDNKGNYSAKIKYKEEL